MSQLVVKRTSRNYEVKITGKTHWPYFKVLVIEFFGELSPNFASTICFYNSSELINFC